jgi:putative sigma-54 modulation protein
MKVSITGRKVTLKDAFKERVEKKLGKFERFFDEDAEAFVTVTVERDRQTVELTIKSRGMIFRAEETTRDMLFSFDAAVDTLMGQIRKNKTRLEKRLKVGAFEGDLPQASELPENYQVLRVKKFDVKPMDVDEAILQMNLSGHVFYTFLDTGTGQINVVYRRHDGGYGVLEPVIE